MPIKSQLHKLDNIGDLTVNQLITMLQEAHNIVDIADVTGATTLPMRKNIIELDALLYIADHYIAKHLGNKN